MSTHMSVHACALQGAIPSATTVLAAKGDMKDGAAALVDAAQSGLSATALAGAASPSKTIHDNLTTAKLILRSSTQAYRKHTDMSAHWHANPFKCTCMYVTCTPRTQTCAQACTGCGAGGALDLSCHHRHRAGDPQLQQQAEPYSAG